MQCRLVPLPIARISSGKISLIVIEIGCKIKITNALDFFLRSSNFN